MTGEKIRSLRKDHKPGKDEDLLGPDEEAATGTFTSSTRTNSKGKGNKIFSNHKIIKSATQHSQSHNHQQQTHINANTNGISTPESIDDKNKNPIIRSADGFPVHECVFKGDVRRLSSLIRTQNIAQKDVHGKFEPVSSFTLHNVLCFIDAQISSPAPFIYTRLIDYSNGNRDSKP